MNSLEFIDGRVKVIKKQIKKLKDMINKFSEELSNSDNDTQVVSYLCLSEAKDKLQEGEYLLTIYQQIKTILEAWEVVKEELQITSKSKNPYGEPLRRYELNVIGQNKIDTLNKALEVKDE